MVGLGTSEASHSGMQGQEVECRGGQQGCLRGRGLKDEAHGTREDK